MKKKMWLYLVLIVLCVAAFWVYRRVDRMRTDTVAPTITVEESLLQVSVLDDDEALLAGVTAQDDVDGDVTASLVVENVTLISADGRVNVTYAAFDQSGNVAKTQREVQYTDYEGPHFTLSAPLMFAENSGFDILSIITAEDMLDGDISHWIRATSLDENTIATAGDHQVKFRVTNSLGDPVELVLPVEVYTLGTYQGRLELSDYLIYLDAGTVFDAKDYLVEYSFNGTTYSLQDLMGDDFAVEIVDGVDPDTPGVYTVTYYVNYYKNGTVYVGCSKLLVVVEG